MAAKEKQKKKKQREEKLALRKCSSSYTCRRHQVLPGSPVPEYLVLRRPLDLRWCFSHTSVGLLDVSENRGENFIFYIKMLCEIITF